MSSMSDRMRRVVEEMTGNEALLEMLETEAAREMLNWGIELAASLVKRTEGLEDASVDLALLPRLKAVRQTMRAIGNWAAGKYTDPESRVQLRDRLLGQFRVILGEDVHLPSAEQMDEILKKADDREKTPHQLILELKQSLEGSL